VGSLPFLLAGRGTLTLTQALFESTSGWTTAGLSILDLTRASPLLLFYRSLIQVAGAAGLVIILLSALAGPTGPGLTVAEGRSEQLLPNVRRSAQLVLRLYAGYLLAGVLGLRLAGMSWFDAVNHAFAAVSTGGFSTRAEAIAYWDSPAVEAVLVVLMLLGSLNFLTAYTLLCGKVRAALRNNEVQQTAAVVVIGSALLFFGVTAGLYPRGGAGIRSAVFNTVSALSTTGFALEGYGRWNSLGWWVLIVLMLMGGGTGSTAGGIKQYRVHVLIKGVAWEFRRLLLPRGTVTAPGLWRGEERTVADDSHLRQVGLFVFLYLAIFFLGSGLIAAQGYSLDVSLFELASALSTVGLSAGITTPVTPAGVLWVEMVAMFLGRLEFLPVVVGLVRLGADVPVLLFSHHPRRPRSSDTSSV